MFLPTTEVPSKDELAQTFVDPPASYGPIDGWWWEAGRLDEDKMRWQLEELKDKGISGTWFYARYLYGEPLGSDPGYFSDGWWDYTRFAAEEQKRLGLINWFSNWTALQFEQNALRAKVSERPELGGRRLVLHRVEGDGSLELAVATADDVIDAASYRKTADGIDHSTRIDLTDAVRDGRLAWTPPDPGWILTVIAATKWDLDYISPVVGEEWCDVVLREYERRLPDQIGDALHAFGPDEMSMLKGSTLYSEPLMERLASMIGGNPRSLLIGLFDDIGPKTEQIRCNYYEVLSQLLDENFYAPPARWLHDRSMLHVTLSQNNNDLIAQTWDHGDFFRYLKWFDVPGNEDPMFTPVGHRRVWATKVSSSVAHLYDKPRAVVLGHYAAGWGHTLEENLAWAQEEFAKGLNLYSRHLGSYSLMGGWYEYVPPHDHWYHPYWRYWKTLADHFRRLSYVLSQGKHRADVAFLYPLTAVFAQWRGSRALTPDGKSPSEIYFTNDPEDEEGAAELTFEPGAFELSAVSERMAKAIYDDGIDFDFVDDASMERAEVDGDVLKIGGLEFRSVVLPPMRAIRRSTLEKIKEFYDAGGAVIAYGTLPVASAEMGRDDPELFAILDHLFEHNPTGKAYRAQGEVSAVPDVISNAIVRDVVASEKGIFQTHQKIGDVDVYFVFSTHEVPREVSLRLRVGAEVVERWDPTTGERYRLESTSDGETTDVTIWMETYEGALLVCSAPSGVDAEHPQPPAPAPTNELVSIPVDGPFTFRVEPTMDNRWGDFRYPASDTVIGAEARRFRYREAPDDGTDAEWHTTSFDDGDWEVVQYTHGPYWLELGPFSADEPEGLLEKAIRGDSDLAWKPYSFSKRFGSQSLVERAGFLSWFQHLIGVPQNFLVLDAAPPVPAPLKPFSTDDLAAPSKGSGDHHHYLFTTVVAPEEDDYIFRVGRKSAHPELSGLDQDAWLNYKVPAGTRLWINGDDVLNLTEDADTAELSTKVHLRAGENAVLLRVVHVEGMDATGYAAFLQAEPVEEDPFVMSLLWFREPQQLVYDIKPNARRRVGWYRFDTPPGVRELRLNANAPAVDAWVDGRQVDVREGSIILDQPARTGATVALRVQQHPGTYGGAAFDEPIEFVCDEGQISLGDWSSQGLPTYSGIGIYATTFAVTTEQVNERLFLDLGDVKTVAELFVNGKRVGVRIARPFRFDITDFVTVGTNTVEVKVANTLANHYSTYPTKWVFEGQTVSGLLGPVWLRILRGGE